MLRRLFGSVVLTALAVLVVAAPALAGGWATVTLDSVPEAPQAGQTLQIGFMVRQHGRTPINSVQPHLLARSAETGESLNVDARQEGPTGHFVAEVKFPSAGTWEWEIIPEPFGGTKFAPLTVLPPSARAADPAPAPAVVADEAPVPVEGAAVVTAADPAPVTAPDVAPAAVPAPADGAAAGPPIPRNALAVAGVLMLVAAAALALTRQPSPLARRIVHR